MDAFLKTLQTLPEVAELVSRVENGRRLSRGGDWPPAGAAGLHRRGGSGRVEAPHGVSLRR